ncbi:hypothetical protein BMS3Bbin11_01444 [bacterium BMS3Bbin11]|nr:hypothetical protein BMS3Abin11_00615 [bacterium BMS3Abin11]GBE46344.1 hypothetical protein BMS3Bbin11_01444 [bacterium BMS3Bbin11]GMT40846.1 MAG: hypothetical protein IEMM0001_1581 [bacterium]
MNSYLTPKISSFFVANLRNSQLLRAICASNLNILDRNLLRPELIRGSLIVQNGILTIIAIASPTQPACVGILPHIHAAVYMNFCASDI